MTETLSGALLNSLWQGSLLTLAVWLVLRRQTRWSAATRLAIWQVTLAVVLLLPALRQLPLHRWFDSAPPVPAAAPPASAAPAIDFAAALPTPARPLVELPSEEPAEALLATAVLLAAFQLFRLAVAYLVLRRWKRKSQPAELVPPILLARQVAVRLSSRISMPMAVGYRHPAILLPEAIVRDLTPAQLEQVLLHESAHLARGDDWATLGERLVRALFAFHPAVYCIGRQLDREREMACDDWVIARSGCTKPYADALARVAELSLPDRAPLLAAGAGRRKEIFVRLEAMLDSARNRIPSASHPLVLGAGLLLLFAVAQSTPYSYLFGFGNYHRRHVVDDGQTRREFKLRGDVEFTADDQDIAHMPPGSKLILVAGDRRAPRQLEIESQPNGEITRLYSAGGVRQPYDQAAQRFLARELSTWLRNEPINVSERLSRWLAAGGPESALREIRTVTNDHTKRLYLEELLVKVPPTEELLRRTLRAAAEISSDHEKSTFLVNTAPRFRGYDGPVLSVIDTIPADRERRELLTALAPELPLVALPRFASSVARIDSDHDRAEILLAALTSSGESQSALLTVVPAINSDHEKARVLQHAATLYRDVPPVREAFFAAVHTISSDRERREVLEALLRRPALSPETVNAIAQAAQQLTAEHEREALRSQLPAQPNAPAASQEAR